MTTTFWGEDVRGERSASFRDTVAESLALAVAPSTGRFQPCCEATTWVAAGMLIGFILGGCGRADPVRCPVAGEVRECLAAPGEVVRTGQALVWLERDL